MVGGITGLPRCWGYVCRNLALQVVRGGGDHGHESRGTQTRERLRWRDPEPTETYTPDHLSEREPHVNKTVTVQKKEENWSRVPMGA
jgi:hypothetical protein